MSSDPRSLLASESRQFPQERARRTYEALVAAGAGAFAEKGFDATQTPDIAARAGVSVGTFYRYFSDKKEIFLEIMRRYMARATEEVLAKLTPDRFVGVDRRLGIEAALEILLENVEREPGMQRVFLEMALRDEQVAAVKRAFDDQARERIAELIRLICPPEDVVDPAATAYLIQTAVVECALHICGTRGPMPVSRERSLAALTEVVYRTLFGIERQSGQP